MGAADKRPKAGRLILQNETLRLAPLYPAPGTSQAHGGSPMKTLLNRPLADVGLTEVVALSCLVVHSET